MTYRELSSSFDCDGHALVGIVSVPAAPRSTGVVIVVGGPQYRAGSHRQFVLLARAIVACGFAVLRFDYRGMGDSDGAQRNFEQIDGDIAAAMAALRRDVPTVERIVLWGLCDGASAALMYWQATRDPVVAGLCLANPWLRSAAGQARTQVKHYYTQRLRERAFWTKLLSGKVAWSALTGLASSLRKLVSNPPETKSTLSCGTSMAYGIRMAEGWRQFPGPVLLLLSGRDFTAKEFTDTADRDPAWRGALAMPKVQRQEFPEADHTFSDLRQCRDVEARTCAWLDGLGAP